MTKRLYGDDEVREIFSLATTGVTSGQPLPAESGGLTLDDIQRIGAEAGIEPARVAQAASQLDARTRPSPVRHFLGLPIGISREVPLPRAPTDREWEQLISQFRTTFGAPGVATTSGGLREWTHGGLHIAVEPTEHGDQLRLSVRNEGAVALNGLGIVMTGMAILMSVVVAATGEADNVGDVLGIFGGIALAAFATNFFRSPRWARVRQDQLEAVAVHAVKLLSKA